MSFTTIIKQFIEMKRPEKGRRIQHTAEIIGTNFSTSGQTGDEAVELLLKAVQEVLTGSYQPSFFQFRGTTIAIYRDAHSGGWMFAEMTEQAGSFHLHPRVYEHGPRMSGMGKRYKALLFSTKMKKSSATLPTGPSGNSLTGIIRS